MANILARFRRRTKSWFGVSALGDSGVPFHSAPKTIPTLQVPPELESPALEKRIHPDLDSLVANWDPSVVSAFTNDSSAILDSTLLPSPPFATALRPRIRRQSVAGLAYDAESLEDASELSAPFPSNVQSADSTRARRLMKRIAGSSRLSSVSSSPALTSTAAGWSTFGRRAKKPHDCDTNRSCLHDFIEYGRGSPTPSQGTSFSRSASLSRGSSRTSIGASSFRLEQSVNYSYDGHEDSDLVAASCDIPFPSSGFAFGCRS
ncbi:hypothetical protein R3P38DRAFT_1096211 [Favolaschia claudopus]|uniref:Uncharacterized protein n=1 Tax=Favolaschia claudopus TaxID=2862362 RepID=A0AAW0BAL9_9AGAR